MKTGDQLKAEGQAAAAKKAGDAWREHALAELRIWLRFRRLVGLREMTFDAFRSEGRVIEPRSVNAWGTLPRSAVKAGLIEPTDRVVKAKRASAQSRAVKVWSIAA